MLRINILIVVFLVVPSSFSLYDEEYRPQIHFSPLAGWLNDPNGLVYHDGFYHLFHQYHSNETVVGTIHWGHAISTDLIHWKYLPLALYPTKENSIYSGSAIIDKNNVTGLRITDNIDTLIAVFTAHDEATAEQKQWLAYSNDGPEYKNFKLYENNPIIPNPNPSVQKDFRDPAVFKYKDHYVIALAAHDRIMIYNSPDLLKWKLVSEFGMNLHGRVRECPSLFPVNTLIDGEEIEKWVLTISLWDIAHELPIQQYFIGSFDGKIFTNDYPEKTELWVDYGPDSYAGIVFNQVPNRRSIFISWMNRWKYARSLNFTAWNGNQLSIPRELKLKQVGNQIRLSSLPIFEFNILRTKQLVKESNIPITDDYVFEVFENGCNKTEHLLDIEMTLDLINLESDDSFHILFSGINDYLNISFKENEFTLDRSHAGRTGFPNFAKPWKAQRLTDSSELKMRIIIDRSSFEIFVDDGLTVISALFFSTEDLASKMTCQVNASVEGSMIKLKELNVYQLKDIWNQHF